MRRSILLISFVLVSACSEPSAVTTSPPTRLSPEEVEQLEALGRAGQGWAYGRLADDAAWDAEGTSMQTLWHANALNAGSPKANLDLVAVILVKARQRDKGSRSRRMLLEEAKRRVGIAVINSVQMPINQTSEINKILDDADNSYIQIENLE